jgi:trans-aconitate 2-methyltransferase
MNRLSQMDWDGATYDRVSSPQARWGKAVLDRLVLNGDEHVLDAGCGTGRVTAELVARVPRGHVTALDASPSMLAQARARLADIGANVRFVQADLLDLGPAVLDGSSAVPAGPTTVAEEPGKVDAILSTATFHWVTDHDRLFANLRSVLRTGGQLVAQCGGRGNIANVIDAVRTLGVERAGTWLYAGPEETASRLERAGFGEVSTWCNPETASFPAGTGLVEFLEAVCLREHLATMAPDLRRPFAERVATAMPAPVIEYVRLNMVARAR